MNAREFSLISICIQSKAIKRQRDYQKFIEIERQSILFNSLKLSIFERGESIRGTTRIDIASIGSRRPAAVGERDVLRKRHVLAARGYACQNSILTCL